LRNQPPEATHDAVARALDHFDVAVVALTFVSASENTVYRVDAADGRSYALRVHRPGYHTLAELKSENAWTTALSDAGVDTPRPVPTRTGAGYATVPYGDAGDTRHVGMIEWLEGEAFDAVVVRAGCDHVPIFRDLGRLMARMHAQAVGWQPPAGFTRHTLDGEGLIGDDPWWGPFWHVPEFSAAESALVLETRAGIRRMLREYGTGHGAYSLIHSDLLPPNVLVRPTGGVAAIDFDDAAYGYHAYDLAVGLHEFTQHPDFDTIRDALLEGYAAERTLDPDVVRLLPIFLLVRCLVEIGWFESRLQGHLTYNRGGGSDREALIRPLTREALDRCEAVRPLLA
jgi:Ser/Thr protein kinase RdoA (MazF antagonist)